VTEPRRHDTALALAACLYAAAVIPLSIHKGGDFTIELGQSERLLRGLPPFGAADPALGVPWPPFGAAALIPFALVARMSLPLAKGLWAAASIACVWGTLRWTAQRGWYRALLALAAVAVPLQTNFEHLNIAAILLALVTLAIADLESDRETRAGVAIGLATALKAFPGLVLVYFAAQRRWRALAVATLVAGSLTVLALAPLGVSGAVTGVRDWLALGLEHQWASQPNANQSLAALLNRLEAPTGLWLIVIGVLIAVTVIAVTWKAPLSPGIPLGVGAFTVLAVLASPIAWVHSFLLLFVAWLGVLARWPFGPTSRLALLLAGLGTSGILTIGPRSWRTLLLSHSVYAWSALLLWAIIIVCLRASQPTPTTVRT
jgi:alpha-1,2-mannosyltransferase